MGGDYPTGLRRLFHLDFAPDYSGSSFTGRPSVFGFDGILRVIRQHGPVERRAVEARTVRMVEMVPPRRAFSGSVEAVGRRRDSAAALGPTDLPPRSDTLTWEWWRRLPDGGTERLPQGSSAAEPARQCRISPPMPRGLPQRDWRIPTNGRSAQARIAGPGNFRRGTSRVDSSFTVWHSGRRCPSQVERARAPRARWAAHSGGSPPQVDRVLRQTAPEARHGADRQGKSMGLKTDQFCGSGARSASGRGQDGGRVAGGQHAGEAVA